MISGLFEMFSASFILLDCCWHIRNLFLIKIILGVTFYCGAPILSAQFKDF
jgi:hypothetical protein